MASTADATSGAAAAPVAGVIPCAGVSRRMGASKALLDAGDGPFLRHAIDALRGGGCDPVVVVVRDVCGPEAELARAAGALVVANPEPEGGPVTSLRAALEHLGRAPAGVAYLPVDHPLVTAATVRTIVDAFRSRDAPMVVPLHRGARGHPPVFARALFAELADPSLCGGARTVVHRHLDRAYLLEVDDPAVLLDLDTPEAYQRAFGRLPG